MFYIFLVIIVSNLHGFDIFKSLRGVPRCNSQADEEENFIEWEAIGDTVFA